MKVLKSSWRQVSYQLFLYMVSLIFGMVSYSLVKTRFRRPNCGTTHHRRPNSDSIVQKIIALSFTRLRMDYHEYESLRAYAILLFARMVAFGVLSMVVDGGQFLRGRVEKG